LVEDEKGLYFESKIVPTQLGSDVMKLYEEGVINQHSIGFATVQSEPKEGYNQINEVKLYEFSAVTWGANEETPTLGMKSKSKPEMLDELKKLQKAIRNGTFTDETFILLEFQVKKIEEYIKTLDTKEPSTDTPNDVEPSFTHFYNFLKSVNNG